MSEIGDETTSVGRTTLFAEDIAVGERMALGEYTLTRDDVITFARSWDDQWFHTDQAAATHGHFGDVIASGIHTLAILQKLTVQSVYERWAVVAGRGFDRVRFVEAVRPGDTLTGTIEITDVVLDERRARVTMGQALTNQHGRTVLVTDLTVMVFRRPAAPV